MPTKNKIIPDKTPIAPVILITRPMMISLSAKPARARLVVLEHAAPSGSSFVLDCANDRREYGAASASSDRL